MKTLELWYRSLPVGRTDRRHQGPRAARAWPQAGRRRSGPRASPRTSSRSSWSRRATMPVIKDQLPTIFHHEAHSPGEIQQDVAGRDGRVPSTLPAAYQALLDRFELRDAAMKVVGIGSVGTSCWVLLFTAGEDDPLFLQVKEARASVLEPYAGSSVFTQSRPARRLRLPDHAAGQRHLPGLGRRAEAPLLRPPVARHQDQRPRWRRSAGPRWTSIAGWCGTRPGPVPRALGIVRHAERLHGQERRLRQGHRRVLAGLRRSEREGPRRPRSRGQAGQAAGGGRRGVAERRRCELPGEEPRANGNRRSSRD